MPKSTQEIISELDALRPKHEWFIDSEGIREKHGPLVFYSPNMNPLYKNYIIALHNGYESLRRAELAGEQLASDVDYSLQPERDRSTQEILIDSLSVYRSAVEGKE